MILLTVLGAFVILTGCSKQETADTVVRIGSLKGPTSMGLVELNQPVDIQVRHAVAVSQHEGFVPDVVPHALDPSAGHCVQPGIHYGDFPGLGGVVVDGQIVPSVSEVVCNVRGVQEIVREIFFDDVLLIACANNEFVVAVMTVQLHDVPENGLAAQFHHRLWLELAFFADAGSIAAGEDKSFHKLILSCNHF